MDKQIFQVPAGVSSVKTMSGCLRIQFDTQQNLTPEQLSTIFGWIDQVGHLTFAINQIDVTDLTDLPPVQTATKQSRSYQLRTQLWHLWNERFSDKWDIFDDYYNHTMNKLIEHYEKQRHE